MNMRRNRRGSSWLIVLLSCLVLAAVIGCHHVKTVVVPRRALARTEPRAAHLESPITFSGGPSIRVGAWNIEHFGNPASRQQQGKDVPQDVDKLADTITRSGVSVLAVCEVYVDEKLPEGNWQSDVVDSLINELDSRLPGGSVYGWDYLVFENANSNDTSQLCGVVWNWNAIDAVTWWPVPVAGGHLNGKTLWDRRPHAVKFVTQPNKTDFVVVPLHMKAGSFANHRGVEAEQLTAKLGATRETFDDRDIILIGDTNCGGTVEPAVTEFQAAGLRDLNGGTIATTPWRTPLDRAFVANDSTANAEFVGDFTVVTGAALNPPLSEDDFRKWCSDHFMIYTTVRIMDDDDP